MDFVAIDFETANYRPHSACQLAAVVVQGSRITAEHCWLIRPPRNYFAPSHIAIHGIRASDVEHSPTMAQIWPDVQGLLSDRILVAHNARFDVRVLLDSLAAYQVQCPSFQFHCTRVLAAAAWPGRQRYGLKPLGQWLGIQFRHHDALEDARCCARIALAIAEAREVVGGFEQLEQLLQVTRGRYHQDRVVSPRSLLGSQRRYGRSTSDRYGFPAPSGSRPPGSVCTQTIIQSCGEQPLAGKRIVMLGPLRGLTMPQTEELLVRLGGSLQTQIDRTTDFVVAAGTAISAARQAVADACARSAAESERSESVAQAETTIRVLSERQFRALLPGGAASLD